MNKFIWVRQPLGTTTYVDHRGDDNNGDGSAQNPYQTILKATTVATLGSNIMLGDGVWSGDRYSEKTKTFIWYGNSFTIIKELSIPKNINEHYHHVILLSCKLRTDNYDKACPVLHNCIAYGLVKGTGNNYNIGVSAYNSLLIKSNLVISGLGSINVTLKNSIAYNFIVVSSKDSSVTDSIDLGGSTGSNRLFAPNTCSFCNLTISNIIGTNNINNQSTGQTIFDYFNYIHPNVLSDPDTATLEEWLACDFTAKPGSANIGAGTNGGNIGFDQGYPARATNDSNDIFAAANGATLRNVAWNAAMNGYSLVHKDQVCAGYTVNTITLAADAEAIDDYYNGLFIGITAGDGAGEIHRIVDYNGATRVATIDTSWQSAISTSSIYSISGTIDSATKDFGRVIKVKRNWAFMANMQSWTDPNDSSYGMWKEFLTSPLQNNGEWMMRPCINFRYEYSRNGTEWRSSIELLAGTDSDNRTYNAAYGNASESYSAANAKITVLRYVRYHIEIGFNIGEDAQ